jgi:hypothetical protein
MTKTLLTTAAVLASLVGTAIAQDGTPPGLNCCAAAFQQPTGVPAAVISAINSGTDISAAAQSVNGPAGGGGANPLIGGPFGNGPNGFATTNIGTTGHGHK